MEHADMKTILFALFILISLPATAEGFRHQASYPADYKAECGSCHDPYPPGLLNKSDWGRIMQGLDKHFGSDASLDNKAASSIGAWLEQNSGQRASTGSNPPRFTTTAWFKRLHREVPANSWKDPRVKTPAYCTGCHKGAAQGRYGENEVSLPGQNRRYEDD
jgi:hypothetical protein